MSNIYNVKSIAEKIGDPTEKKNKNKEQEQETNDNLVKSDNDTKTAVDKVDGRGHLSQQPKIGAVMQSNSIISSTSEEGPIANEATNKSGNNEPKDDVTTKTQTDSNDHKPTQANDQVIKSTQVKLIEQAEVIRKQNYEAELNKGGVMSTYERNLIPKEDEKSYLITNDFRVVDTLDPYIVYDSVGSYYKSNVKTLSDNYREIVLSETMETFSYGTLIVKKVLNEKVFGTAGILVSNGAVQDPAMIKTFGLVSGSSEIQHVFGGIVACLSLITDDRRIFIEPDSVFKTTDSTLNEVIRGPILKKTGPNPGLIPLYTDIKWLRNDIQGNLDDGTAVYYLGRCGVVNSRRFGNKTQNNYAANIDMYSAAILNTNIQALLTPNVSINDMTNMLRAHAIELTRISASEVGDLRPDEKFDTDQAIQLLVLIGIMYPKIQQLLLEINTNYIMDSGFVTMIKEVDLYYENQKLAIDNTFTNFLTNRVNEGDDSAVHQMIAGEMTPQFQVRLLTPLHSAIYPFERALLITELMLFCWFFPNTFEQIKGEVQNYLLQYIGKFWPDQWEIFMQRYGTTYRRVGGANIFSKLRDPWIQEDMYLSNLYPSLFSGEQFNDVEDIKTLMSFFVPLGERVGDIRATEAGFPRLSRDPHHYIPYVPLQNFDNATIPMRFASYHDWIRNVVKKAAEKDSTPKSMLTTFTGWLNFMSQKLTKIAPSYQVHLRLIYRAMGNFALNFDGGFDGNFATYKKKNYCIQLNNGNALPLILYKGETLDDNAYISTANIWSLIGSGETTLMKQAGDTYEGVVIPVEIKLPEPDVSLRDSMQLIKRMKKIIIPQAITTLIFSKNFMNDNADLEALRALIPASGFTDSGVRLMANRIAQILGAEVDNYGQIMMKYLGNLNMMYRMVDPVIRQYSLDDVILPFDPNVDPEAFRHPTTFLTKLQIDRVSIGLKMLMNSGINSIYTGVRLAKMAPAIRDPDFKPRVLDTNYRELDYSHDLFIGENVAGTTIWCFKDPLDNRVYSNPSEWPMIWLTIANRDDIILDIFEMITKGIMANRWIVDVLDVHFTANIIGTDVPVDDQQTIIDVFTKPVGTIFDFKFQDGTLKISMQSQERPKTDLEYQYLYPLEPISSLISARGLTISSDRPPAMARAPQPYEYDTGTLAALCQLRYSDNRPKLNSENISMTNVVRSFADSVRFNSEIKYTMQMPASLVNNLNYRYVRY